MLPTVESAAGTQSVFDLAVALADDGGGVDLLLEDGDLALDRGLRSAALVSLFSDARDESVLAEDDDLDPRGWWAEVEGESFGSLLWALELRAKRTRVTLDLARLAAERSLSWMVARGIASRIEVTAEPLGLHGCILTIQIHRNPGTRLDALWDNERLADIDIPGGLRVRLLSR